MGVIVIGGIRRFPFHAKTIHSTRSSATRQLNPPKSQPSMSIAYHTSRRIEERARNLQGYPVCQNRIGKQVTRLSESAARLPRKKHYPWKSQPPTSLGDCWRCILPPIARRAAPSTNLPACPTPLRIPRRKYPSWSRTPTIPPLRYTCPNRPTFCTIPGAETRMV